MKKLLATVLILSLLIALPALAAAGASVTFENRTYILNYEGAEIEDGKLQVKVSGFGSTLPMRKGQFVIIAWAAAVINGKEVRASSVKAGSDGVYAFCCDTDSLPEKVLIYSHEDENNPILLWEGGAGSAAMAVPEELVGEWRGTGKPKNGGPSIELSATINADGSGEYVFIQDDYRENYPFTITSDGNRFSVDVPATSQLGSVDGSWALDEGVLKLDITSTFLRGGSYSYTAECKKVSGAKESKAADPGAEAPAWAGRDWQLDSLHFKTLSKDSPFSIDAGMSLNGPTEYGSRLYFDAGAAMASDINLNGLIEAVPQLPFSVPELNLTQYDSFALQENSLRLTPGDLLLTLAYDAASDSLSLTYVSHVEVQSQTLENGMVTKGGETDIEITLGFVPKAGE